MSRDPQAQVNYKSGNVVCDNMRVREDIILSGAVRGHNEAEIIKFNNNVQMLRDFCVDGNTTIHGNLIVDGTINNQLPFPLGPFSSIIKTIDLTGKVVVVTGVSRGQGRYTAQLIRAAGAIVIGTSRHATGYPTPGLFEKPAFIPQVSPLLATADVLQTCDYLLRMDLTQNAQTSANGAQALTVAPFTLVVNGTFGFPAAGTLTVQTVANGLQNITYTGITATSFTNCIAGGAYNIADTGAVYQEGSIQAFSAVVHEMFATGPLVGLSLYAMVQNGSRLFVGNTITSTTNLTAARNYQESFDLIGLFPTMLVGHLFDLMPTTSDARIIIMGSIGGYSPGSADLSAPYYAGKKAQTQLINSLIEEIGNLMVAYPGEYQNFRVCSVNPIGSRTTLFSYPVVANPNGDIGVLPGADINPLTSLLSGFLPGLSAIQDLEQTGNTIIQLLTMLEPPTATFTVNDIFYDVYFTMTNPLNGFPPANEINDNITLIKWNASSNILNALFTAPALIGVGFPRPWDVIPAAPGSYVNPFTGAPVDSSAVPIIVIGTPLGTPTIDFQYKINNGPWLGEGTFTFGVPFPPAFTSAPVNLSAYTGQTITITVRTYTLNGNPVVPYPTGNAIQTDATVFFYKVLIE